MKKIHTGFFIGASVFCVLLIITLATNFWKRFFNTETDENVRARIITPRETDLSTGLNQAGQVRWDDGLITKIPLEDGEVVIAVINRESEEGNAEEQYVAFSNASDAEGGVYLTCIAYDAKSGAYRRMWTISTAAARTETISLSIIDLVGDRNNCIIVTGMNVHNQHTMTIFRKSPGQNQEQPFNKIAEFQIDGSISIQETVRSQAYQQGITNGESFNIAAYSHDNTSSNILDQIETIYSFNPMRERYEQTRLSRIPGSQIEQRRVQELLSGTPGVFENFINDLWYYASSQGAVDSRQYIYFDPSGREIIFFGDEAQQVFHWQSSTHTRYGLYIRSQNISISTLLRFIDIELESLDSIRLRVIEDVRLPITVNTTWDGSYRRAGNANEKQTLSQILPAIDAFYDSSWGRIQFNSSGEYAINSSGIVRRGRYVFYKLNGNDMLELRPNESGESANRRPVYKIENVAESLILSRVRIGNTGIQDMLEPPVTLTPVN